MIHTFLVNLFGFNPLKERAVIGDIEPCGFYTICPKSFEIDERDKHLFNNIQYVD
jgi:hypothetical protein